MIVAFIGKMRQGKTLGMNEMVIDSLNNGRVVFANYYVNWDPMAPMTKTRKFWHFMGIKFKRYPKENLRPFNNWEEVVNVANAVIALDEGWQYFDSYNKLPIDKRMRLYQSGKWNLDFYYTVQRYMMADINLRWCTDQFWEATRFMIPIFSYPLFRYRLYDLEEDNEGAKIARVALDGEGKATSLHLRTLWFVFGNKKRFAQYDTTQDIYATAGLRQALSHKVDVGTASSGFSYDSSPTIWQLIAKPFKYVSHRRLIQKSRGQQKSSPVVRRELRGKEEIIRGRTNDMVERIPSRRLVIRE